ncbi:MAG: hypothetical protein LBN30_08850 [Oscillospiraceae bacterium]|jgi:hypothetical protein|nr:hypothetical protein [Oscillospiraceae bacterium]
MQTYDFVKLQMKRIAKNTTILGIIAALLLTVLLLVPNVPTPGNLYISDAVITSAYELRDLYESRQYFVSANAESFFDTGYYEESDGKPVYNYYAFASDDVFIVCKTSLKLTQESYTDYLVRGQLREASSLEWEVLNHLRSDLADAWEISSYEAFDYISTYIIDVAAPRIVVQLLASLDVLLIVCLLVLIVRSHLNASNYKNIKLYTRLDGGNADGAERVNTAISREFETGEFSFNKNGVRISRSWIIRTSPFGFKVHRKADLIWVYKVTTRHRTNGIPTGKTYSVMLWFTDKTFENLAARSDKLATEFVETIDADCPGIIAGYSDEINALFNSDLAAFIKLAKREEV